MFLSLYLIQSGKRADRSNHKGRQHIIHFQPFAELSDPLLKIDPFSQQRTDGKTCNNPHRPTAYKFSSHDCHHLFNRAAGTVQLYARWHGLWKLIDDVHTENMGCEYGVL